MSLNSAKSCTIKFQPATQKPEQVIKLPYRAELIAIDEDGSLIVQTGDQLKHRCDWLETHGNTELRLELGDQLLVMPPTDDSLSVVIGRIGKYQKPQTQQNVTIEASETLTLKCGEASVELRSDGKAMLKGEDVLLRAKGTQRIRAGTVAIN